ncbi:MAG: hypothetical protein J0I14_09505 [Propionibacteriaceae bacterium]|jgi:hypothetical protein|nr:hypothetical protein [Propionibacteriaceae bacterium]
MTGSRATTAWVVSGAIGLVTFTAGMLASQGGEAAPAEPRPAIVVNPDVRSSPTATAATEKPSPSATATATAATAPSPVSPPSAETPD